MKDLASLSRMEFKQFLDSFDNILSDCDGVIFPFYKPITGVEESILKLRQCGKCVRFVTNNNIDLLKQISEKFDEQECIVSLDDFVNPVKAMIDYLKSINFDKEIFLMGFPNMGEELKRAGFKLAKLPGTLENSRSGIKQLAKLNPNVGAVISDIDINFTFAKLFEAALHLRQPDVLFMTGATDKNVPFESNFVVMGPGYYQQALIDYTGRTPLGLGKPGLPFNKYVNKKFNITNPARTLFVGDTLQQDIGFGSQCGYQTLLVLTGATTMEDVSKNTNKEWVPDYYVSSFGDLHQLIKDKLDI